MKSGEGNVIEMVWGEKGYIYEHSGPDVLHDCTHTQDLWLYMAVLVILL